MSADSDERSNDRMGAQDILRTRQWVKEVRAQYYGELAQQGSCSRSTHQLLQTAVLRYWDAIHEYRDEDEDLWEEKDLDEIPRLAEETVRVSVSTPGYGQGSSTHERPAISQVSADSLVELTHRMDEVAHELGFGAEARQKPTQTEITEEMVEDVEEWRQQNLE